MLRIAKENPDAPAAQARYRLRLVKASAAPPNPLVQKPPPNVQARASTKILQILDEMYPNVDLRPASFECVGTSGGHDSFGAVHR